MNQRHRRITNTRSTGHGRRQVRQGPGRALRQLHSRVLQGHLQPTLQRSSLFASPPLKARASAIKWLNSRALRTVSIGVARKQQPTKSAMATVSLEKHCAMLKTARHHFTTGPADTVLSGPSPVLALVSSESKSTNINGKFTSTLRY